MRWHIVVYYGIAWSIDSASYIVNYTESRKVERVQDPRSTRETQFHFQHDLSFGKESFEKKKPASWLKR